MDFGQLTDDAIEMEIEIGPIRDSMTGEAANAPEEGDGGGQCATVMPGEAANTPAPAEPEDSLLGQMIGNFKLVRQLGKGGMGTVYLGVHPTIGSQVAVKVLHQHLASDPDLVTRFYTEARAVNLVRHENVVTVFDINTLPPNRPYLVMEYLEGRPLSTLRGESLPADVAIRILVGICNGLEAAHAHVVHRDLKPDNIFLIRHADNDHFVKLADFGIAKIRAERSASTLTGMVVGTPEYMAPEQFAGEPVDPRTDLYALGVIAYQLITGRLPFTGNITALFAGHCMRQPVPPRKHAPGISAELERVILKAMEKMPADRFQNAAELRAALLQAARAEATPQAARPEAAPSEPVPTTPVPRMVQSAPFPVWISRQHEQASYTLIGEELSHGGLFVRNAGRPPPLRSIVKLVIPHPSGELSCTGEVIRHISAEQGRAWGMHPGFAVQFLESSPEFRRSVDRLLRGIAPHKPTPVPRRP